MIDITTNEQKADKMLASFCQEKFPSEVSWYQLLELMKDDPLLCSSKSFHLVLQIHLEELKSQYPRIAKQLLKRKEFQGQLWFSFMEDGR